MTPRLLDSLSPEARQLLLQQCRRTRFGSGAFLFHSGEAGDTIHMIASGRVAVLAGGRLGEPLMLTILGPGDVFGELALLNAQHRRTATIQALSATETLVLHRSDFDELRHSHPGVDRFLIALLAAQVERLTQQLIETTELPAHTRIYRRLAYLGTVFEVAGTSAPIPVTQAQLASMAGVKLRITSEVIRRAKADGLVTVSKRRVAVLDWPEVHRRAHPRLT